MVGNYDVIIDTSLVLQLTPDILLTKLKRVDVHQLKCILVPDFTLKGNSDQDKKDMFSYWLDTNHRVSWNDIVNALKSMKEHSLARSIENKYCKPSETHFCMMRKCYFLNFYQGTQLIFKQRRTNFDSGSTGMCI